MTTQKRIVFARKPDWNKAAWDLYRKGVQADEEGRVDEAIGFYRASLDIESAQYPMVNLGTIAYRHKDFEGALLWYDKALEIAPGYPLALFNRANLYDDLAVRYRTAAERDYRAALTANPDYADAVYNLGLLVGFGGRLREGMSLIWHYLGMIANDDPWRANAQQAIQDLSNRITENGAAGGSA